MYLILTIVLITNSIRYLSLPSSHFVALRVISTLVLAGCEDCHVLLAEMLLLQGHDAALRFDGYSDTFSFLLRGVCYNVFLSFFAHLFC